MPASKPKSRRAPAPEMPPSSSKAAAAIALNNRVDQAALELVADSEPITGQELTTMLLEQIPEAERTTIEAARRRLLEARKIEKRGDSFIIPPDPSAGPITNAEREAVGCLGSGKTAREVALNCDSIRDATAARAILEGLVRRSVIRRREGSDPWVYEAIA